MLDQCYTAQGIGYAVRNAVHALHGEVYSERSSGYKLRNLGYAACGIEFVIYSLNCAAYGMNFGSKKAGQETYPVQCPFYGGRAASSGLLFLLCALGSMASIRCRGDSVENLSAWVSAELQAIEVFILPAAPDERRMRPRLDDTPVLHDIDTVGALHRR